jgi:hypothetical protein
MLTMDNANKNSIKKSTKPLVKKEVTEDYNEQEFSNESFGLTNNRLAKKSKKIFKQEPSDYISQCSDKSMGLMEIFKLKNILNYKDLRSVIHWCCKNEVFIIRQGNKQFVNRWEFILSFYKPFIEHLKRKHENWKEMFLNYLNGEIGKLMTTQSEDNPVTISSNYKPKTKKVTSFLNKIKKI